MCGGAFAWLLNIWKIFAFLFEICTCESYRRNVSIDLFMLKAFFYVKINCIVCTIEIGNFS